MSPLPDNALIYDDNCPLCSAYTTAFVKGGLLQKEGRISFSEVNMQRFSIDWNKAKHEIPLINLQTGEVSYGVEALVNILSKKWRWIKPLFEVKMVNLFFKWLYKLISYNRKIIAASKHANATSFDCTPDYSFFWRLILIIITYSVSAYIFDKAIVQLCNTYHFNIPALNVLYWIWLPLTATALTKKKKATDIIAHLGITLMLAGTICLCLVKLLNYFWAPPFLLCLYLLLITVVIMQQVQKRIAAIKSTVYS